MPTSIPLITPYTTIPNRQNPSTFSADRDTRLQEEATRITQQNSMATAMNTLAGEMEDLVAAMTLNDTTDTSSSSVAIGTGSKTFTVTAGKSFITGMSLKIAYNSLNWMLGEVTSYSGTTLVMNITAIAGSGTKTSWTISLSGPIGETPLITVPRSARTSNTMLAAADNATLVDITSGTFTQTFTAAASLGDGWWCYLRNSGTGDITLNPDGSEQIDGLTSYIMYPQECRLIQCTGTAFYSIVISPFIRTITTTLNPFYTPPGYANFQGLLWGGGGSGGYGAADRATGGGGGGACVPFTLTATQMSTSQIITIGAGGTGVTSVGNGNVGGNSTIGALVTSYGGGGGGGIANANRYGGSGGGALSAGNAGGVAAVVGGRPAITAIISNFSDGIGLGGACSAGYSTYGGAGGGGSTSPGGNGGNSLYGGAGGGGIDASNNLLAPGTSVFGGNGGAAVLAGDGGIAGTQPAGGGGATHTGTSSGAGGDGMCIIWGVA